MKHGYKDKKPEKKKRRGSVAKYEFTWRTFERQKKVKTEKKGGKKIKSTLRKKNCWNVFV